MFCPAPQVVTINLRVLSRPQVEFLPDIFSNLGVDYDGEDMGYIYLCVNECIYAYTYISIDRYIYIEREREMHTLLVHTHTHIYLSIYLSIHTHTHTQLYVYIYMYTHIYSMVMFVLKKKLPRTQHGSAQE